MLRLGFGTVLLVNVGYSAPYSLCVPHVVLEPFWTMSEILNQAVLISCFVSFDLCTHLISECLVLIVVYAAR